jgi:hypothetical protein
MILADRLIPFLAESGLSDRQYILLHLVYLGRKDLIELYKNTVLEGMKVIPKTEMEVLREKGFLKFNNRNEYIIAEKFLDLFVDKFIATDEVFEAYPAFVNSNGVDIPLTTMDRNVFANMYMSAIQGNLEEHREILKDIAFAKEQKLLNFGIEKFITSRVWLKIRERRLANIVKTTTKTRQDNEF